MTDLSGYLMSLGVSPLLVGLVAGIVLVLVLRRMRGGSTPTYSVGSPSAGAARATRELTAAQSAAVSQAIRDGRKIEAIKLIREATGLGLKESKDLAEAMEETLPRAR